MAGRVEGRVAFVTGAARGAGRGQAVRLAEEGADVIMVDLLEPVTDVAYAGSSSADLDETVRQVEALGRRAVARKADVRDFDELSSALSDGVDLLGGLDIVVANAGIGARPHLAEEIPEDVWRNMLDTNLTGVWHTAKAAIPHLKRGERGGSIVLINSTAGLAAIENVAHYVTSKHGVIGLMRTLALELAPFSIRVNSIHPTQIDTPMVQNQAVYSLFTGDPDSTKEEFAAASKAGIALPIPWVESIDIANAVLFLASEEARYITGVPLPVDGGYLIT